MTQKRNVVFWTWTGGFLVTAFCIWISLSPCFHPQNVRSTGERTVNLQQKISRPKIQTDYPVIAWWAGDLQLNTEIIECSSYTKCHVFSSKDRYLPENVDAYLFYASSMNLNDFPLPRRFNEVIWGLFHEESPRNVPELMHEKALNLFNFSSTFSRYSDVPIPLAHLKSIENVTSKKFFIETKVKNSFLGEISPILYLQSDCETSTQRDEYVKSLMEYIPIDSYGKCLNNKALPESLKDDYLNKLNDDETLKFIAKYKFMIAIENGVCEDYITEKFWRAINVGTVPIYFGSPSIRDWLPNKQSAILIEDFATPQILADHLKKLNDDDKLYEEHLEHKIKGQITNKRLINELEERCYQVDTLETLKTFECYICKQLFDIEIREDSSDFKGGAHVVNTSHYNCPKPVSMLKSGNASNMWVSVWETAKVTAQKLYQHVEQGIAIDSNEM